MRPASHRFDRVFHHPQFRLASDVHHRRPRRAGRLVPAEEPAGIAALAGIERPHRGSGSVDGRNREGSRDRGRVTGACRCGACDADRPVIAVQAAAPAAATRRLLGADYDQHAHFRICAVAADLLPAARAHDLALVRLHPRPRGRIPAWVRGRRLLRRLHRAALEHHWRVDRDHRARYRLRDLHGGDARGGYPDGRLRAHPCDLRSGRDTFRRLYARIVPDRGAATR